MMGRLDGEEEDVGDDGEVDVCDERCMVGDSEAGLSHKARESRQLKSALVLLGEGYLVSPNLHLHD